MNRVTFLTGYYGSGKTELAVNLAIKHNVDYLVDLDIINPYFRTREMEDMLREKGIETISSEMDGKMHLDMPYISKKIYLPLNMDNKRVIYDLGGNDLGAKLLRQFDEYRDIPFDIFLVVNVYRMETSNEEQIIQLIRRIEGTGGFKVTGLINNSNMLKDTTVDDILFGQKIVENVSKVLNIPVVLTTYWNGMTQGIDVSNETLSIELFFRKKWF